MNRPGRITPVRRVSQATGKVSWLAKYPTPDGRHPSAGTFNSKKLAQEEIDKAVDRAWGSPGAPTTIAGYLPRWLDEHPVSERTMQTNRGRINAVLAVRLEGRAVGDWEMRDITRRHAKDLIAHLFKEQERAPEGVRGVLRALSAMFTAAIADDLCEVNPWQGHRIRSDDKRAVRPGRQARIWSWEQMFDFAAHAGPYEAMIRTMAECGLRPGELFALRRSGLLVGEQILQVRGTAWNGVVIPSSPQKNHDRDVPITDELAALLAAMPAMLHTEWLFPTPGWRVRSSPTTGRFEPIAIPVGYGKRGGKLWRYPNWKRRVWDPTIERAGIDPAPGEFRHSWVSHLRDQGINPAAVAAVAGHTVETESRVYTKRVQDRYEEIRSAVGQK